MRLVHTEEIIGVVHTAGTVHTGRMAAPDFHEIFWAAIAAAAPVIGLASAVNVDHTVRRSEREMERATRKRTDPPPIPNASYWMSYINIGLQAVALLFALYCLGTFHDHLGWGRQIAAAMAFLGMVLVLAPAWWTTTRLYRKNNWWTRTRMYHLYKNKRHSRAEGGDGHGPADPPSTP